MNKKNILKFLVLILILLAIPNITFAQENLKRKSYVNDYADILDEETEKELTNTITDYIEKYKLDIAIVTTHTSYLLTTEQFANYFYDCGGVVVSAAFDSELNLKHVLSFSREELHRFQERFPFLMTE